MNRLSVVVVAGVLVAGSAFTLTACGSEEPSLKEASMSWWKTVSPDVDSFQNHLMALSTVSGYTAEEDMVLACVALKQDVNTLQAKDSFPKDPVLWDEMLNTFEKAWDACLTQDYGDMLTYGEQGNVKLEQITDSAGELNLNR